MKLQQHEDFPVLRDRVYGRLLSPERRKKYPDAFVGRIRHDLLPQRIQLLVEYYTAMREIDDVIDGDAQLPSGYESTRDYLQRKRDFLSEPTNPQDEVENVMVRAHERLESIFGTSAAEASRDAAKNILACLDFDISRQIVFMRSGTFDVLPEHRIDGYVHEMELNGAMKGVIAILGDDYNATESLEKLVNATRRHFFFLRDLQQDTSEGRLNVTQEEGGANEDFARLQSMSHANGNGTNSVQNTLHLYQNSSSAVQSWMREQIRKGMECIKQHEQERSSSHFRVITRLMLNRLYKGPASAFFKKLSHLAVN